MFTVYQHWDPLKMCLVGSSYPPDFYSWIDNCKLRKKFERLATETEEDYQLLINVLQKFDVQVIRPKLPADFDHLLIANKWLPPPVAPRDYFIMIHDQCWVPSVPNKAHAWKTFYRQIKKTKWSDFERPDDFFQTLNEFDRYEISAKFKRFQIVDQEKHSVKLKFYEEVFNIVEQQGNQVIYTNHDFISGCFVSRIGKNLFFATQSYYDDQLEILEVVDGLFTGTTNQIVNAAGHGDCVYCPVAPGLIISLRDISTYANTFPDWEVVYLPPNDFESTAKFRECMKLNKGRWFLPGFSNDKKNIDLVDYYFDEWVGMASETVFDVNILIIDPTNIVVSSYNRQVENACRRHGIEMHVVPFRHRYFWDAGTHCITNDIHRNGICQQIL